MCFLLYLGTTRPIPRTVFNENTADLPVESLTERDAAIGQHFSRPEVQYVGSSSSCGCDFPHAMFQNEGWPEIEVHRDAERDEIDITRHTIHRQNCGALVALLRATGESMVEVYGVWDGDFAKAPKAQENISVDRLLDPDFYFKEQGFYKVWLEPEANYV